MHILVVEDYAPLRESVTQALREAGYAVDESADGQEGLWHAQSGQFAPQLLGVPSSR